MRDLWRPGSGMTPRRLAVLIRALPPDALLWAEIHEAMEKAKKPTAERIRERQRHYDQQKAKGAT